jgi:hypothetical protein
MLSYIPAEAGRKVEDPPATPACQPEGENGGGLATWAPARGRFWPFQLSASALPEGSTSNNPGPASKAQG